MALQCHNVLNQRLIKLHIYQGRTVNILRFLSVNVETKSFMVNSALILVSSYLNILIIQSSIL